MNGGATAGYGGINEVVVEHLGSYLYSCCYKTRLKVTVSYCIRKRAIGCSLQ